MSEHEHEQEETQEQDGPEPEPALGEPTPEEEEAEHEEHEQVEGVPGEPEEGEQPSGAVGAVGEKELEKMFKRVDTANASYAKKLGDIMGEEAGVLETCPRCADPFLGFIFPPTMKPVSAEVKDAVLVSIGEAPALASEKDPYSRQCDTCKGSGVVRSGSKRNSQKALRCLTCDGRGWVPIGDERSVRRSDAATVTPTNGQTEATFTSAGLAEQMPDEDLWGRKVGDPDYGVHPMYVASR